MIRAARIFDQLGLTVFERGWLSSNNIVFGARDGDSAAVVDTGYDQHAQQTLQLLRSHLGNVPLERVINTHLHSDHCGGNAMLQEALGCETAVPSASFDAVRRWDEDRLSFEATGQRCRRFRADRALCVDDCVRLAGHDWQLLAAPGHDPDALMLFQPDSRVLISADALWEDRLAVVFPELGGDAGFGQVRQTLDVIERLEPSIVIPGHGAPFGDVAVALAASRARLERYVQHPERHANYAYRALLMFHMLEQRRVPREQLVDWMLRAPIFGGLERFLGLPRQPVEELARQVINELVIAGLLRNEDGVFALV